MREPENDRYNAAGDLFGEMYLAQGSPDVRAARRTQRLARCLPGLAVTAVAAAAAAWLSGHYGFPLILLGLLIGLGLNFVGKLPSTHDGLDLASTGFLRVGIVLLGFQVTLAQVATLGPVAFGALACIMLLTFGAGLAGAKVAAQSRYCGILAGGATAICGASAALALYSVIGKDRLPQAQFALTLVGVSLASALAMSIYPVIAAQIGFDDAQAGFVIGASVHDVAQAIGGGYSFSDSAGQNATIVKLSRVAMLAPVVVLVSLWVGQEAGAPRRSIARRLALPWFITGFAAVLVCNSLVDVPEGARALLLDLSKGLLLLAVTATAMRSRLDLIAELGWRASIPVVTASLASFGAALAFATYGLS